MNGPIHLRSPQRIWRAAFLVAIMLVISAVLAVAGALLAWDPRNVDTYYGHGFDQRAFNRINLGDPKAAALGIGRPMSIECLSSGGEVWSFSYLATGASAYEHRALVFSPAGALVEKQEAVLDEEPVITGRHISTGFGIRAPLVSACSVVLDGGGP